VKIVSYVRETFLEFENHISLVLFCYGCNMKCSYCYNYDYVTDKSRIIDKPVETIIDENITPLTDSVVFLGGEVTIYGEELLTVSDYVKSKHRLLTKVFSNGTNPKLLLEGLHRGCFDFVSVDFKCYFPSDIITYNDSWINYLWGMDFFLNQCVENNYVDRIEVRMTVVPEIEKDVTIIKKICDKRRIKFVIQDDVKSMCDKM